MWISGGGMAVSGAPRQKNGGPRVYMTIFAFVVDNNEAAHENDKDTDNFRGHGDHKHPNLN
jgi:hypothetical protein